MGPIAKIVQRVHSTKRTPTDRGDRHGLLLVFPSEVVQCVFKRAGNAPVVFWNDKQQAIGID